MNRVDRASGQPDVQMTSGQSSALSRQEEEGTHDPVVNGTPLYNLQGHDGNEYPLVRLRPIIPTETEQPSPIIRNPALVAIRFMTQSISDPTEDQVAPRSICFSKTRPPSPNSGQAYLKFLEQDLLKKIYGQLAQLSPNPEQKQLMLRKKQPPIPSEESISNLEVIHQELQKRLSFPHNVAMPSDFE